MLYYDVVLFQIHILVAIVEEITLFLFGQEKAQNVLRNYLLKGPAALDCFRSPNFNGNFLISLISQVHSHAILSSQFIIKSILVFGNVNNPVVVSFYAQLLCTCLSYLNTDISFSLSLPTSCIPCHPHWMLSHNSYLNMFLCTLVMQFLNIFAL